MSDLAKETHRLLREHKLRPNKRLGQNFLISEKIVAKIIEAADIQSDDEILEIGCGLGLMARDMAQKVKRVVAVELDRGLAAVARDVCRDSPAVSIFQEDILKMEKPMMGRKVKVIGNLPYYATSPILARLIEWKHGEGFDVSRAIVMVQREVADRMLALPGSKVYGSFSVFMQFWTDMKRVCQAPSGAFYPSPDVGSSLLAISFRDQSAVSVADPAIFFEVVRAAFGQRRKMLRQALQPLWLRKKLPMKFEEASRRAGVSPTWRAEQVDVEGFARLADEVAACSSGRPRPDVGVPGASSGR